MNTRSLRTGCAALWLIAVAGMAAGCSGGGNQAPTPDGSFVGCTGYIHADDYAAGMIKPGTSGKLSVQLASSDPGPPIKGTNSWSVVITDSSGAPVDGATIQVLPFMPYHGHGTQVVPTVTAMPNGAYQIAPLYFYMAGLWQTTLTINTSDGMKNDSVSFSFCIDG
ncbi:MAG TPA: FixH family protein [Polyangia bacterium]|nr:FixH family protein [Polyangia bacterium]